VGNHGGKAPKLLGGYGGLGFDWGSLRNRSRGGE